MTGRWRLPASVTGLALFGLLAMLATLQYRWVGQISAAERDRMRETLASSADAFVRDVDGELTRAYLLFQTLTSIGDPSAQFASQYDRWQATAHAPKMLSAIYRYTAGSDGGDGTLERFDPETRTLRPADWPPSMSGWRERVVDAIEWQPGPSSGREPNRLFVRRLPSPLWNEPPALVIPVPRFALPVVPSEPGPVTPSLTYTILAIDRDYMAREMLPALAAQHFRGTGDTAVRVAVVDEGRDNVVLFRTDDAFAPATTHADLETGLFSVRTQDFDRVAAEVRQVTAIAALGIDGRNVPHGERGEGPLAMFIQRGSPGREDGPTRTITTTTQITALTTPAWRLVVQHRSGSLEAAVSRVRRRNLMVSMSILGVLGAAMGMLTLATRRAQDLARRQMEFVATVSHELRTPLAVLRSAADNLADGVVHDEAQARRYGEMMRTEGRRLTVMVEQILEFAGLASGQRVVRQDPVSLGALLREVAETAAPLALQSGVRIELDAPDALPPAAGDEPALRRVFENLVANAVKYGVDGKWVGIRAGVRGEMLEVAVSDRGIGIAAADQARIFEPFYRAPSVVAAQVQGAGLGLSLVQRIVQAHGGTVTVESAEGAGAAFTVRLPIAREPAALSNEHPAVTSGAQSPRLDWS